MITTEKYTILEKPEDIQLCETKLCILNFDILNYSNYVKNLVQNNPDTTFWTTSDNFSKSFIKSVSRLGIQNVIQFPIKTQTIEKFFSNTKQEQIQTEYKPLKSSKILIVDDNEMNIELIKETLADLNITITACSDPVTAINRIKSERFDLLLLDILMPEYSGFELAEIARKSEFNHSTKIIFISAISESRNKINGYKLGACSYIEKPFSPCIAKAQIYNFLKTTETEKAKKKEEEHFVATLTHDLKSPINAEILALNQLIKTTPNKKNTDDEMLTELLNSAKYMKQITDNILSHYKQKTGKLILKKEYVNPYKLIMSSIEELKYLAVEKNINIRFCNSTDMTDIFIDSLEIKRVINNLITNAIEYSYPNGYIDIKSESDKNYMTFEIKDNGAGVDLSKYKKIFDEYVTLSKENKKIGFGLGLSICKNIIEAHGGEINIYSELKKGTTVKFYIPINEELD